MRKQCFFSFNADQRGLRHKRNITNIYRSLLVDRHIKYTINGVMEILKENRKIISSYLEFSVGKATNTQEQRGANSGSSWRKPRNMAMSQNQQTKINIFLK